MQGGCDNLQIARIHSSGSRMCRLSSSHICGCRLRPVNGSKKCGQGRSSKDMQGAFLAPPARRFIHEVFENRREMSLILEPDRECDFDQAYRRIKKHSLCSFDTLKQYIFAWRAPCGQAKLGCELTSRQPRRPRHVVDEDCSGKVRGNEVEHLPQTPLGERRNSFVRSYDLRASQGDRFSERFRRALIDCLRQRQYRACELVYETVAGKHFSASL